MSKTNWLVAGFSMTLLLVSVVGAASPHEYVQAGVGDVFLVCDGAYEGWSPGLSGVCLGDIAPDAFGSADITIFDDLAPAVSAAFCQDLDDDGVCGSYGCETGASGANAPDYKPPIERRGGCDTIVEPSQSFCGDIELDDGSISGMANWFPGYAVYVFIDGPIGGMPFFSACATLAPATHGFVNA